MKKYDDYDYEDAYKKQIDTLEEWELEKLLIDGKVESLYRTTTTKSKNVNDPYELLEAQIYPSFLNKTDVPRAPKKSKPSQIKLNDINARRHLIRLVTINFNKGDLWCTYGWTEDYLPKDIKAAQKDVTNYIKRINYRQKKAGKPNIKYIYVLAFDGYARPHFHIIMGNTCMSRDELEDLWGKCDRPNTRRIVPDSNFFLTGLSTYVSQNPHGTKRWCPSKNLIRPAKPTRSYSRFPKNRVNKMVRDHEILKAELEKSYLGYRFLDAQVRYNGVTAAFYIYARMVRD